MVQGGEEACSRGFRGRKEGKRFFWRREKRKLPVKRRKRKKRREGHSEPSREKGKGKKEGDLLCAWKKRRGERTDSVPEVNRKGEESRGHRRGDEIPFLLGKRKEGRVHLNPV